ncbi:LOW QUALITY PROTEIN: uncharacterized protein LOC110641208 [Hevea brasiliensis]|uniref:LOW QUALITY PROTEIN: uncharacterized protein LOC110641208 n=1 Tax=Hevea brasiliensis TaxID=3981 RepID=UPI0025D21F37|nr:LOW QUALITY PROTEIN: uncharacterized protein LOC110641208 [Hevea brasiliensis]
MQTREESKHQRKIKRGGFWRWVIASVFFRLILIYFPHNLFLSFRPEVSTPVTSLRRLAEGYWLKQASMSPYAGSMYHGSPLLPSVLGSLTVKRIEGHPDHVFCRLMKCNIDVASRYTCSGDFAALVYFWNPFTIVACVGLSTSPMENLFIILTIYGACTRVVPLAALGWAMASHLSLYPAILIIPVILLLGYGLDAPPRKLFLQKGFYKIGDNSSSNIHCEQEKMINQSKPRIIFSWRPVMLFFFWTTLWSLYLLVLCGMSVKQYSSLWEMFQRTYGFILIVEDMSPDIAVLWYFFAEVFDFFRNFFLIVFHMNILFMILPLAIRPSHWPCFFAFVYIAISSMLKSYPSVGDSALYLGLLVLFLDELADMQFSFFIFCGYVGVSLLSPVMHNLWIWRGTGNANFYFATAIAYACLQIYTKIRLAQLKSFYNGTKICLGLEILIILVVESVSAMLNHDRKLRKLSVANLLDGKS